MTERNQGNPGGGRGFAGMDPERQRQIASLGGRAAHESGRAHEFDSEEARAAGRKGGEVVSQNRAHMAEIGRRGGEASGGGNRGRSRVTSTATETNTVTTDARGTGTGRSSEDFTGGRGHVGPRHLPDSNL
jgi:general stress protein YciG